MKTYPVGLSGESFYEDVVRLQRPGDAVMLVPEPNNPHDRRAIRVDDLRGRTIGYIPRESWLKRAMLDEGAGPEARILSIEGSPPQKLGVVIEVSLFGEFTAPQPRETVMAVTREDFAELLTYRLPVDCVCGAQVPWPIRSIRAGYSIDCDRCGESSRIDAALEHDAEDMFIRMGQIIAASAKRAGATRKALTSLFREGRLE